MREKSVADKEEANDEPPDDHPGDPVGHEVLHEHDQGRKKQDARRKADKARREVSEKLDLRIAHDKLPDHSDKDAHNNEGENDGVKRQPLACQQRPVARRRRVDEFIDLCRFVPPDDFTAKEDRH